MSSAYAGDESTVVEVRDEPSHHVAFENSFVRILEADIAPGDTSLYHRHRRTNVYVVMGDAENASQVLGSEMTAVRAVKQGDFGLTRVTGDGLVHRVYNPGQTRLRFTDIELIKSTGHAGAANDPGIKPTAENEFCRVFRLTLGPGETSPLLVLGPGIHVFVSGTQFQRIDKDGRVTIIEASTRAWQWHDEGTYQLRNRQPLRPRNWSKLSSSRPTH